ncbi:MAG: hypothetical protein ABIP74_03975 [Candidatus Saccharimonas sp.]
MKQNEKTSPFEVNPSAGVLFNEAPLTEHQAFIDTADSLVKHLTKSYGDASRHDFGSWESNSGKHVLATLSNFSDEKIVEKNDNYTIPDGSYKETPEYKQAEPLIPKVEEVRPPQEAKDSLDEEELDAMEWIDRHITRAGDGWLWDGESPQGQQEDKVLRELVSMMVAVSYDSAEDLLKIMPQVCNISTSELAVELLGWGSGEYVYTHQERFAPLGADYVQFMMKHGRYDEVLLNTKILDTSLNLQEIVDEIVERNSEFVFTNLRSLPLDIRIPSALVIRKAHQWPSLMLEWLKTGYFAGLDSEKMFNVLAPACNHDMFMDAVMILKPYIYQVEKYMAGSLARDAFLKREYIRGLETIEDVKELILRLQSKGDFYYIWNNLDMLDEITQLAVFSLMREGQLKDKAVNAMNILHFSNLDKESYTYILDGYQNELSAYIYDDLHGVDQVLRLFENADEPERARFEKRMGRHLRRRRLVLLEMDRQIEAANIRRASQRDAELTYYHAGNVKIDYLDSDAEPTDAEILRGFEYEHCIKHAPLFAAQVEDESRTNQLTYVKTNQDVGVYTDTDYRDRRRTLTEHDALLEYNSELKALSRDARLSNTERDIASSLRSNLTFIGEKEYQEAARATASYWKQLLDQGIAKQVYIIKSPISSGKEKAKSDVYMFDRILAYFNDEELVKYKGRLIVEDQDIASDAPADLRVILLDDWTVSGAQMRVAAGKFVAKHPSSKACIEIDLIAASRERISLGLEGVHGGKGGSVVEDDISIPIKAYYMAHHASVSFDPNARNVHITGAHSSVDFGFELELNKLVRKTRSDGRSDLPPLANIVRPYREPGFEPTNIQRLEAL